MQRSSKVNCHSFALLTVVSLQVTFLLKDSNGEAVSSWVPGNIYVLDVPPKQGVTHVWVHASDGELEADDSMSMLQADACENAIYSIEPAASHTMMWFAPANETAQDVTFSAAHATSPESPYSINSVWSLAASGSPCPTRTLASLQGIQNAVCDAP
jgi:hypothetical protein